MYEFQPVVLKGIELEHHGKSLEKAIFGITNSQVLVAKKPM